MNINPQLENDFDSQSSKFHCTIIESKTPSTLTKTYELKDSGEVEKDTIANLYEGVAYRKEVSGYTELADLLKGLKNNQALCYGQTGHEEIKLTTKKRFEEMGNPSDWIPRTKDDFHWPSKGCLLLDYDPAKGEPALSRNKLYSAIHAAVPALANVGSVWWVSSSSNIYNSLTGEQITGENGQRIYYLVADATDIPRAGKVLNDRLFLAGHGRYEISRSGALLERSLFDGSVFQTNRLDFASGANCIKPLEQRRGEPLITDGIILDTRVALPDLSPAEKAELAAIKEAKKAKVKGEAEAVKQLFIMKKSADIAAGSLDEKIQKLAIETVRRAVENSVLVGDYPITLESGEVVTIADLLDNPSKYHGALTLDPLEPDYLNCKVVGKLYLFGSRPTLHSFAHGGRTFRLIRQPRRIELIKGRTFDAVNHTVELMREMPDIYDMGHQIVTVIDGGAQPVDEPLLTHWLGGTAQYFHLQKTSNGEFIEVLDDPPARVVKAIIALGRKRKLKPLDAVISAPIITPSGIIVNKPGYHEQTRLYLDAPETLPSIPDNVTIEMVRNAIDVLMYPYKEFPFCTELDKAILLQGLLTAVLRPILPTAPCTAFDATVPGSGKTLLASCLAGLATGGNPTIWSHTAGRDDEEVRKRLFTALRTGERALIWDNVTGVFDSVAMAALLTSASYTDRQLGKSELSSIPNRTHFIMTGNNLTLSGDLPRRVLKCRIDPQTDRPYARQFGIDPLAYTLDNRQAMVAAALTIVRGWIQSADYVIGIGAPGRMASFEIWDDLVRQSIAWINREVLPGQFADVMDAVDDAQSSDPEQDALYEVLCALRDCFGDRSFSAKEILAEINACFEHTNVLKDAISDVIGREIKSPRSLGRVLKFRTGRVVNGLSLDLAPKDGHANSLRWRVKSVRC
jgi:hypothetical protein